MLARQQCCEQTLLQCIVNVYLLWSVLMSPSAHDLPWLHVIPPWCMWSPLVHVIFPGYIWSHLVTYDLSLVHVISPGTCISPWFMWCVSLCFPAWQVMSGFPHNGRNRGEQVLNCLQALGPNLHEDIVTLFDTAVPRLVTYLTGKRLMIGWGR